jgi:hypothetical protein
MKRSETDLGKAPPPAPVVPIQNSVVLYLAIPLDKVNPGASPD